MNVNLIMQEHAARDKRSVAAMLSRAGDGREKRWLQFEQQHQALMSQEEIQAAFERACRYHKVVHWHMLLSRATKGLCIALGLFLIVA